jgi:hypothetical protein
MEIRSAIVPAADDRHADAERQERVHSGWEKNRVRAGRNADNPVRSRSVRTGLSALRF